VEHDQKGRGHQRCLCTLLSKANLFTSHLEFQLRKWTEILEDDFLKRKEFIKLKKKRLQSKRSAACKFFLSYQDYIGGRITGVDHVNDIHYLAIIILAAVTVALLIITLPSFHCYSNFTALYSFAFCPFFKFRERIFPATTCKVNLLLPICAFILWLQKGFFKLVPAGSFAKASFVGSKLTVKGPSPFKYIHKSPALTQLQPV